jgi:elongation factor Tu
VGGIVDLVQVLGAHIGLLLRGLKRDDVERGQVVPAPGAIKAHAKGRAQIFVLTKEEGGRRTPFTSGYTPQFFLRRDGRVRRHPHRRATRS